MQNILINMCEKFHDNRLRNDRALGNGKSDNNTNPKNNNKHRNKFKLLPLGTRFQVQKIAVKWTTIELLDLTTSSTP